MGEATLVNVFPSRPSSRNDLDDNLENDGLHMEGVQKVAAPTYSYAAVLGASLSRSNTPNPQVISRSTSPCPTPVGAGRVGAAEKRTFSGGTLRAPVLGRAFAADLALRG
ncbi:hypothetical protein MLD38_021986 [Melastoma candidum]|uniref:Uncharacterized protein n=1 Tax=Melastoma candidum TaxID=119954 RepID=A0ACB9QH01_9MYRT|nr:hypothetical protein MLD38_021986 [Melastoma candidum]